MDEKIDEQTKPVVLFQHVIITLADGRRGVFMGPALIKEVEMKLNMVPKLVSIDFDPPRAVDVPISRDVIQQEEQKNANTEIVEKPAGEIGLGSAA